MESVEWKVDRAPVDYLSAVAEMEARVAAIRNAGAPERIWLLEHPPLYTAGTSAKSDDLVDAGDFPVYSTGRGGQFTYHGPGQRIIYVMLDLNRRSRDVRRFVSDLEQWVIDALDLLGVAAGRRPGRVGIWIDGATRSGGTDGTEDKIAAIGVRLRRWVTFHGISINLSPDLGHFDGIVPCGISDPAFGVTSLEKLGLQTTYDELDDVLKSAFGPIFGPVHVLD
jgi:lipoyl(octanoyl) transferase